MIKKGTVKRINKVSNSLANMKYKNLHFAKLLISLGDYYQYGF